MDEDFSFAMAMLFYQIRGKISGYNSRLLTLYTTKNPSSLGIWLPYGELNITRLDEISDLSVEINGHKLLTKNVIPKPEGWAIMALWPFPLLSRWVTEGSINDLINVFGDLEFANGTKAISTERFKQFYLNGWLNKTEITII